MTFEYARQHFVALDQTRARVSDLMQLCEAEITSAERRELDTQLQTLWNLQQQTEKIARWLVEQAETEGIVA